VDASILLHLVFRLLPSLSFPAPTRLCVSFFVRRMSTRRTLKLIAVIAFVAAVLAVGNLELFTRPCGHREAVWSHFASILSPRLAGRHDCVVMNKLYIDFRLVDAAQDKYQREHGSYATSFDSLTNVAALPSYEFHFTSDGQHWSVAVPPLGDWFPGHYLITEDRRIHFSRDHSATTNDVVLCKL